MDRMRRLVSMAVPLGLVVSIGCQELPSEPGSDFAPQFSQSAEEIDAALRDMMATVNSALEAEGANYRVGTAEWLGADMVGNTVFFFDVGNKRLEEHFVSRDPRRAGWSGAPGATDDITYAIDQTIDATPPGGLATGAQTTAAIQRAMATWDGLRCSSLPLVQVNDFGLDLGVVAFLFGLGGSPFIVADVMHAGWRDINFIGDILGVTFTFVFLDAVGDPTDVDGDGRLDVAFREIYYDPSWVWRINGNIDVESVALHEAGHGLSQAHFGQLFRTDRNGRFHFAPFAVMNAGYTGPQQALQGTDSAGHCSLWGGWPNS